MTTEERLGGYKDVYECNNCHDCGSPIALCEGAHPLLHTQAHFFEVYVNVPTCPLPTPTPDMILVGGSDPRRSGFMFKPLGGIIQHVQVQVWATGQGSTGIHRKTTGQGSTGVHRAVNFKANVKLRHGS
jgi:hypothetical protein